MFGLLLTDFLIKSIDNSTSSFVSDCCPTIIDTVGKIPACLSRSSPFRTFSAVNLLPMVFRIRSEPDSIPSPIILQLQSSSVVSFGNGLCCDDSKNCRQKDSPALHGH